MRKFITDAIVREALEAYLGRKPIVNPVVGGGDEGAYWSMENALRAVVPLLLEGLAEDVRDHTVKVTRIRARAKI